MVSPVESAPMPSTKFAMRAPDASDTAPTAGIESSPFIPPLAGHVGSPSVASRMNFGLVSVRVAAYAAAAASAARVGVLLLPMTPPIASVRPWIAFAIAAALAGPIGTWTLALTPQAPESAKYLRPQFTFASVVATTRLTAAVVCAHFELAPQLVVPQAMSLRSRFIEAEASSRTRMSGLTSGTGTATRAPHEP